MPYARNGTVNIYYEAEGEGPPVMILHGLTGSLEDMKEAGYAEALKKEYTVILVDLRGHGKSDKPHEPEEYTTDRFVGDILAVQDSLGIGSAHILGYSYGGGIAFECAIHAGDRVKSLIAGGAGLKKPPDEIYEAYIRQLEAGPEARIAALEMAEVLPQKIKDRILSNDHEAIIALCRATMSGAPLESHPDINMPVLLFAGEYDPAYQAVKETGELLPQAEVVSFPGLDHVQAGSRLDLLMPHLKDFLAKMS